MKWNVEKKIWKYINADKKFAVEVHRWEECGKTHWNKYLYLYPGHPDFGKYRPSEKEAFPETPYDWNYGITYYNESYDKHGELKMQTFGDDYSHLWDERDHLPLGEEGNRVFVDAEQFIKSLEGGIE